jgi:hypothetical protein
MNGRFQEDVMRTKGLVLGIGVILIITGATAGFSQTPVQNRIPQQIIVNGQTVNGAYVTAPSGGIQSFTCNMPQQYTTPDGASQGWACYEQATGVWLLNAIPPAQAQAPAVPAPAPLPAPAQAPPPAPAPAPAPLPQQPAVVYPQQPPPTVIYQAPPPVIYTSPVYAPYPYPVVVAPAYPPSVLLGTAAINAAGRIAAAAIIGPRYVRVGRYYGWGRRW